MKKLLLVLSMALGLFSAGLSTATASDSESRFNANELSILIGTSYAVDKANIRESFDEDYDANFDVGARYFLTRNIGLEATLPVYSTSGQTINNVDLSLVERLPVLKYAALYARQGANYQWENQTFTGILAAGVEVRLAKGWGVFAEGNYRFADFDSFSDGNAALRGGLSLSFK
jgi:hypothetical protein